MSEGIALNATTQQFVTTAQKYEAARLKNGVRSTHNYVRAIYSCKIRVC